MIRIAGTVSASTAVALGLALLTIGGAPARLQAQGPPGGDSSKAPKAKLGLAINDPKGFGGYTLINTMNSKMAYLIDRQGKVVHRWNTGRNSLHCAYLLANGHLLRPTDLDGADRNFGAGPGAHGRLQEFTWDGEIVWDYKFFNDKQLFHHDLTVLPNGNILLIVWDRKTKDEAIAAGRNPQLVGNYLLPDSVVEVKPTGKTTGSVVWEWHLWDHLIQDHDSTKPNFGDVAAHAELVDINFVDDSMAPAVVAKKDKDSVEKLKAIGYVGSPASRAERVNPDWTHVNAIAYNADLDQIMLSVHEFSEVWIIDHSTTTAQAADHEGGRYGKGGDLLYRCGNPRTYRAGKASDQRLFAQHDAHWIQKGLPGEGHMLVFNNGPSRPDGKYSSVDEIVLPVDEKGFYPRKPEAAFGPEKAVWSYSAPKKSDFYSVFISGTHRLPNGNTQICSGANGTVFEVTPDKVIVWKYVNPAKGGIGPGGPGMMPKAGQVLPSFLQDALGLSPEQRKAVESLQKEVDDKLAKSLTDAQKKQFQDSVQFRPGGPPGPGPGPGPGAGPGPGPPRGGGPGPGGFGGFAQPGQIMSLTTQVTLKLSPDQRKQLGELQKEVDSRLEKTFKDDQKKQLKQMREDFARGGPRGGGPGPGPGPGPGGPPGAGPGPGGPGGPGGGRGGPPAFLFAGPPGGATLFRAYRYSPLYLGLAGKELEPGKTIDELEKEPEKKKTP
jgi:hypothetical protein